MKQKLLNKLWLRGGMLVAILCTLFAGQAWGDSYTIVFKTQGTGDGTNVTTSTDCSTIVSDGGSYLSGKVVQVTNTYHSGQFGLKLGKSGSGGSIKMNLANKITPTSIVVNAKRYNSSKSVTLSVNGSSAQDLVTNFADYTFNINEEISYIQLNSSNYSWINSITVNFEGAGSDTYTVTYNANGGSGTMTDPNSPYEEDDEVTLLANTFTAPSGKTWASWVVTDESDNTISVTDGKFEMPASDVTVTAQWAVDPNATQYEWVETNLADLTASDIFVIVGNDAYAMASTLVSNTQPSAVSVTISNGKISGSVADNLRWNVSGNSTDGYIFHPNGDETNYLYCNTTASSSSNTNMRIGTQNSNIRNLFVLSNDHLVTKDDYTKRYIHLNGSTDWRGYTSSSTNSTTVKFYKRQVVSNDPAISANNVNILYDAISGSIDYSLENATGNVSATVTSGDWLTLGEITSSSVPFTCSANTGAERTATVTLSFSGAENKVVTVTQAAAPVVYTTIPALFYKATEVGTTATNVNVTFDNWVVSGVSSSNAFVTDNNGNGFIIYTSNHGFAVNDKLSGTVMETPLKLYNGSAEFTNLTSSTTGLTVTNDGVITVLTNKAIADLGGVNTGAVITLSNLTYDGTNLSDGTNTIKPYNTLYAGMNFTSGKTYNVTGVYQQFSETKEILPRSAADIVEAQKLDNSIFMVGPDYTIDVSVSGGGEVNMTSAQASHGTLQSEVVLASTTVDASKYNFASNVLTVHDVTEGGVIVIRYYVDADAEYNAVELLVPIYLKANPIIAYDGVPKNTAYGTTYTIDTDLISGGDITSVSSSNPAVATVDGLTITPVAVGSTTITINTAETNIWHAGTATFTLNVTQPEGGTTAKTADDVVLFHETFGDNPSSARDWNDTYSVKSGVNAVYSGITSYTVSNVKQGKNTTGSTGSGLNQSSAGTDASIIIGPLNVADYENMTLTYQWKAASVGGTYSTSASYATSSTGDYEALTLNSGTGVGATSFVECAYSLPEEAQVSTLYLKIVWNTSNTQGIIDEVELSCAGAATVSVKLNDFGYATFCSEYPLDFTGVTDFSAWQITDIDSDNKITFERVTGSVKGGTGLFLVGGNGATVTIPSADSDNELGGNMLEGTLAPMYFDAGKIYGLAGNTFKKNSAGTIRKNKAYIDEGWITPAAGVKAFTLVFEDDATGIHTVETVNAESAEQIFNLAGQRIQKMQKGINIVNGKKVLK